MEETVPNQVNKSSEDITQRQNTKTTHTHYGGHGTKPGEKNQSLSWSSSVDKT